MARSYPQPHSLHASHPRRRLVSSGERRVYAPKKSHLALFPLILNLFLILQPSASAQSPEAALAFIQEQQPPLFKPDSALPPLSNYNALPFEINQALADHWGYALHVMLYSEGSVRQLEDPQSATGRMVRLARDQPQRYRLQLSIRPESSIRRGYLRHAGFDPADFLCDDAGQPLQHRGRDRLSPLASETHYQKIADFYLPLIEAVERFAPAAILINGGEYGFEKPQRVPLAVTLRDPRVLEAWSQDGREWVEFMSDHKAGHERVLRKAFAERHPHLLYFLYTEVGAGHPRRMGRPDWPRYDFLYREGISDLASGRDGYYRHGNSGFVGPRDILTKTLNSTAQEIDAGVHHSYRWVSGGWQSRGNFADHDRYEGYLRMMYASGSLGGIIGYFGGRPENDPVEKSLAPYLILGRVHALFSHLDEFLLHSTLLPGPNPHRWSRDLPAYELPTGHAHTRVLVRRHEQRPEWLIAAWAADGEARTVTVDIPELGAIEIEATASATLRLVERTVAGAVRELDPYALPMHATPEALRARLDQIVEQNNPLLRESRARHRAQKAASESPAALQSLLASADPVLRRLALDVAAERATGPAAVEAALRDPAIAVRKAAVRWLVRWQQAGQDVAALLEQAAGDSSETVLTLLGELAAWPFQAPAEAAATTLPGLPAAAQDRLDLTESQWQFRRDPARRGQVERWHEANPQDASWSPTAIAVPWEEDFIGIGWYRTSFELPARPAGAQALLCFHGVDESAWVWLNGRYLGARDQGPDAWRHPFHLQITDQLQWNDANQLVVRVQNTVAAGGLYRPVVLEIVSP